MKPTKSKPLSKLLRVFEKDIVGIVCDLRACEHVATKIVHAHPIDGCCINDRCGVDLAYLMCESCALDTQRKCRQSYDRMAPVEYCRTCGREVESMSQVYRIENLHGDQDS